MLDFSFKDRQKSIERMKSEVFDILVIGGGITGAAVAREAALRGYKVALVERQDFATGTSSNSSKLIHGGLRYLEQFEFHLVAESLNERAHLIKEMPHLVNPIRFLIPIYKGDRVPMWKMNAGLWLYDMLALFRTPYFHSKHDVKETLHAVPGLDKKDLQGSLSYADATMWDDVMVIERLREAHMLGVPIANYVDAVGLGSSKSKSKGTLVEVIDTESGDQFEIRAHQVISCVGPWTDEFGHRISKTWKDWLSPSKGVHLVFPLNLMPIEDVVVMSEKSDGRITFVIPRDDYGEGVLIVGTTDGGAPERPEDARVDGNDVNYILKLLKQYFPKVPFSRETMLGAYVGVRPLFKAGGGTGDTAKSLQKVSREHHIDMGPHGVVFIAGGKYTTHRVIGKDIVDFANKNGPLSKVKPMQQQLSECSSGKVNNHSIHDIDFSWAKVKPMKNALTNKVKGKNLVLSRDKILEDFKYWIQNGMVLHIDDYLMRRSALSLCTKDGGLSYFSDFFKIMSEFRGGRLDGEVERERVTKAIEVRHPSKV